MLRYREVLVDWIVVPMMKYSLVASGPMTGTGEVEVLEAGSVCK